MSGQAGVYHTACVKEEAGWLLEADTGLQCLQTCREGSAIECRTAALLVGVAQCRQSSVEVEDSVNKLVVTVCTFYI